MEESLQQGREEKRGNLSGIAFDNHSHLLLGLHSKTTYIYVHTHMSLQNGLLSLSLSLSLSLPLSFSLSVCQ